VAVDQDRERDLIGAAIRGESGAFAALYDLQLERVYRHVHYRVGNRPDAEDLTQQVFLQAWRAMGRFRHTAAPFLAWLFAIAHNVVAAHYRRRRPDSVELDFEPSVNDRWTDPEAAALDRYDRAAVRLAILRLRSDQQQVVIMRFVENLDYPAIAVTLGKSEGNVRVIQHRALQELRRLLAHQVVD
jgi:RNA polymerase sigma-70 factor (ECF subfamily)